MSASNSSYTQPIQAPQFDGTEPWLNKPFDEVKTEELPPEQGLALSILALRSMDYPEYLKTEHWRAVRYRAMQRARWQCQACGKDAVDADHMTYDRRGFERPEDVMALCRPCHKTKHESFIIRARASFPRHP